MDRISPARGAELSSLAAPRPLPGVVGRLSARERARPPCTLSPTLPLVLCLPRRRFPCRSESCVPDGWAPVISRGNFEMSKTCAVVTCHVRLLTRCVVMCGVPVARRMRRGVSVDKIHSICNVHSQGPGERGHDYVTICKMPGKMRMRVPCPWTSSMHPTNHRRPQHAG